MLSLTANFLCSPVLGPPDIYARRSHLPQIAFQITFSKNYSASCFQNGHYRKTAILHLVSSPKARKYSKGIKSTNASALCSCLAMEFRCTGDWSCPSSRRGQKAPAGGFYTKLVELKSQTHLVLPEGGQKAAAAISLRERD